MGKNEKTLLKIAVIGTLLALGMASISFIFFDKAAESSSDASMQADAEGNDAQPMSTGDAPAFVIDPARSEVRFTLGEILGGEPKTVIGVTSDVSGTVYLSVDAPQDASVGEIVVDASGFVTDNSFRNRAIHRAILNTGSYETIRFVPTSISGLPDAVAFGESVSFEISGKLTIKDETRDVTFTAQATPLSETELEGHAEAMIAYADYGILIPSAPRVADVDKEVLLEIDFIAVAQ